MHQHFILHKPWGYLSQLINNQDKRKNKRLLGELFEFPVGTMAIGRLDEKSEGLLLLTTDGKVSQEVRSRKVEKEYYVQVDGIVDEEAIAKLKEGVDISIEGKIYSTLPCAAHSLENTKAFPFKIREVRHERHGPTSWLSVTLREGKFRQVRKMCAVVGLPCLRLVRVRIGNLRLIDSFLPGDVIKVDHLNI
jgi:23S rRNA pseudouridine2457 synthase